MPAKKGKQVIVHLWPGQEAACHTQKEIIRRKYGNRLLSEIEVQERLAGGLDLVFTVKKGKAKNA